MSLLIAAVGVTKPRRYTFVKLGETGQLHIPLHGHPQALKVFLKDALRLALLQAEDERIRCYESI